MCKYCKLCWFCVVRSKTGMPDLFRTSRNLRNGKKFPTFISVRSSVFSSLFYFINNDSFYLYLIIDNYTIKINRLQLGLKKIYRSIHKFGRIEIIAFLFVPKW